MISMIWLILPLVVVIAAGLVMTKVYRIPPGHIGIVYRLIGRRHEEDLYPVKVHGSPGPQASIQLADQTYFLPRFLYKVVTVPRTYVPHHTIGVVIAKVGEPIPPGQLLCRHVECRYFQDGEAFLANGGQQGRQLCVLPGGYYDINPEIFDVVTVDTVGNGSLHGLTHDDLMEVSVPEGAAGVVITLVGAPRRDEDDVVGPFVPGHNSFQSPHVFLVGGGRRGAQGETLGTGVYQINPWFARIAQIPTRNLMLDWTRKADKQASRFDAALDEIVVNVEGHRLRFEMSQTIKIPAKSAPRLVGYFGEQQTDKFGASNALDPAPVQRFVERVLGKVVEGYFQSTAAESDNVLNFISRRTAATLTLAERVREALEEWGVEATRTVLNGYETDDTELEARRRQIAEHRDSDLTLKYGKRNAELDDAAAEVRDRTDRRHRELETAEIAALVRLLGHDTVAMRLFLAELKEMKVPEYVGGDAAAILDHMPLPAARELINRAISKGNQQQLPPQPNGWPTEEPT
jgi:SPFH domain / Band 7 family